MVCRRAWLRTRCRERQTAAWVVPAEGWEYWPGRPCTGRALDVDEEGLAYRQSSALGCGKANKRRKYQTGLYIYKVRDRCLQPAVPLCLILRLPIRYRLPLHIERCIRSPAFERIDVIDDVSGTAAAGSPVGRARMLTLEVVLSSRAARVAAVPSRPRAVRAEGRAMAMPLPRSGEGIERRE